MTPTKPHPRSRRTAADGAPEMTVEALRARVERCREHLQDTLEVVRRWDGQMDLARLRCLRGDLRRADLEAEMVIEAIEKLRRKGV